MKIAALYSLYTQHFLVDTDTRNIRKNTLFFALKGENFNGNAFAEEALKKGALYSIVDEEKYQTHPNIILVDDVLQALQQLANYHRKQLDIPIIGLTGSNGKTTTKELINAVLQTQFKTTATKGNLNNHIGVPLTLLSMTPNTQIGIVEMGANHLLEIDFLCKVAEPDYGYITNFGKAHLEGFGGVEGVIKGKSELYDFLIDRNKHIFVNPNDEIQVSKTRQSNRIFFENSIQFLSLTPFVELSYKEVTIQSHLIGKYNFNNIAAAISIGHHFGITDEHIQQAIENYVPTNNRSQIIEKTTNRIILDAYNANPTSMKAALENFSALEGDHKVAILGDMFELGNDSSKEHQELVDLAESLNIDQLFFVGEHFDNTNSTKGKQFRSFKDFQNYFLQYPITQSTILIKGSRGMALERTLELMN